MTPARSGGRVCADSVVLHFTHVKLRQTTTLRRRRARVLHVHTHAWHAHAHMRTHAQTRNANANDLRCARTLTTCVRTPTTAQTATHTTKHTHTRKRPTQPPPRVPRVRCERTITACVRTLRTHTQTHTHTHTHIAQPPPRVPRVRHDAGAAVPAVGGRRRGVGAARVAPACVLGAAHLAARRRHQPGAALHYSSLSCANQQRHGRPRWMLMPPMP